MPKAAAPQPGRQPARNVIEKILGGCVVLETWDDRQGGTGQSVNIYDRVTKQWHQTWVDNTGGLHQYWDELKSGTMVYVGEVPLGPGMRFQGRRTIRVSFTPMGSDKMRQFSESLNSDGSWSLNYDLLYTRAKTNIVLAFSRRHPSRRSNGRLSGMGPEAPTHEPAVCRDGFHSAPPGLVQRHRTSL